MLNINRIGNKLGGILLPTAPPSNPKGPAATASDTLGDWANVLTASDFTMITAVTGAAFRRGEQGTDVGLESGYVAVDPLDLRRAMEDIEQSLQRRHVDYTRDVVRALATGEAELSYAENFTKVVASLRQAAGPDGKITPSMILAGVSQSNKSGAPIPSDYLTRAVGYMNGIR